MLNKNRTLFIFRLSQHVQYLQNTKPILESFSLQMAGDLEKMSYLDPYNTLENMEKFYNLTVDTLEIIERLITPIKEYLDKISNQNISDFDIPQYIKHVEKIERNFTYIDKNVETIKEKLKKINQFYYSIYT